jgi:RNA polymerase sigma factor (sigma-70 family)
MADEGALGGSVAMSFPSAQKPDTTVMAHPAQLLRALFSARRAIYKICLRCAHGDPAEADDLLAEASLRVVETSLPAQDQIVNPISWWATIIRNIARDRHRQRVCRGELPESPRIDDPAETSSSRALDGLSYVLARRELRTTFDAIDRLPDRQRRALLLRASGADYDEIAREVGTTYANTRKLVQVARRQLRQNHEGALSFAS